jgi:transcriptional regulator GlxA family with amidase domain
MATQEQKTVAFVLYPGLTLLDLVGPLQVFASLRQFNDQYRPVVVAERIEPMPTDGPLTVIADQTFADVPDPEVVIVPGGGAPTIKAMGNPTIRDYLRQAADTVPVVGSVCTGALVLAAAGLLEGRQATTHWAYPGCWNAWAPPTCHSGGWRTASSSPRPGCRPASTWPWPWLPA